MNQFKRAQVIMLPTKDNHSQLEIDDLSINKLSWELKQYCHKHPHHLYIISDDEIKEGDYWINLDNNVIHNDIDIANFANKAPSCKKIIATTDTSLIENIEMIGTGSTYLFKLPQPSQQFITKYIEKYTKGEVITDVLVEYENSISHIHPILGNEYIEILKVNPKDNTIAIKKVKDNWNREEIINIINQYTIEMAPEIKNFHRDKWIKENL